MIVKRLLYPIVLLSQIVFFLAVGLVGLGCASLRAQDLSDADRARVFMRVGPDSVTVGEFVDQYRRNESYAGGADTLSVSSFVEMYSVYRLKVLDAREMGLDTVPSFVREWRDFRDHQLGHYLLDSVLREREYRSAYDRMQREVAVSHILIGTSDTVNPVQAQERAQAVMVRLQAGEDFERLAREVSDDPSVAVNGGHLGFVGAFTTVYPFERAAYDLKVGEISQPVWTQFGYHIIRLDAERPSRGRLQLAHIFIPVTGDEVMDAQGRRLLDSLHGRLVAGEPFGELARRYSQDGSSAQRGGVLPWVQAGFYPESFIELVLGLEYPDGLSAPVRSQFGYHIFRRLSYEPVGDYETMLPRIREGLARSGIRLEGSEAVRREALLREGLRYDGGQVETLLADGNRLGWKSDTLASLGWAARPLLYVGGAAVKGDRLLRLLRSSDFIPESMNGEQLRSLLNLIGAEVAVERVTRELSHQHPRLGSLLRDYYEGTLLFEVSQRKHWNSPRLTEDYLRAYYRKNRKKYSFHEALTLDHYRGGDSVVILRYASRVCGSGARRRIGARELRRDSVIREQLRVERSHYLVAGLKLDSQGKWVDREGSGHLGNAFSTDQRSAWRGGCLLLRRSDRSGGPVVGAGENGWVYDLYRYVGRKSGVGKRYEEARGELMYDCQVEVEREWVEELKGRYPVWVDGELQVRLERLLARQ